MGGRDLELRSESDCVKRARGIAALLKANSSRIEAAREIPADILAALHDARLFRVALPRALDGDEVDLVSLAHVTEIIAAADASTAWCIGQGSGCAMAAAYLDPETARRIFGPREAVLAWGAGVQGTAIAVEGGYRVTGKWAFASGSRHATWLGAHCKVVEADGRPRLSADGRQLERTGLIARQKTTIHDVWQVVGLKGTGSDSYEVRDLFVPARESLERDNPAGLMVQSSLYRFPSMFAYASAFGGVMLGIARGTLDDLRALAMTKTPRGASSSLRESPVFQTQLAQLEARWRAVRTFHHQTMGEVWDAVASGETLTLDRRVDMRLAATHAINQGVEIVVEAYRAAGQNAIFENNPFERHLRDALAASQQVQGRPSHYATVGQHFLGLPPDSMMFL